MSSADSQRGSCAELGPPGTHQRLPRINAVLMAAAWLAAWSCGIPCDVSSARYLLMLSELPKNFMSCFGGLLTDCRVRGMIGSIEAADLSFDAGSSTGTCKAVPRKRTFTIRPSVATKSLTRDSSPPTMSASSTESPGRLVPYPDSGRSSGDNLTSSVGFFSSPRRVNT